MKIRKIDIKPQASGFTARVTEDGNALPHDHAFSQARELVDFVAAMLFTHEKRVEIARKAPRAK